MTTPAKRTTTRPSTRPAARSTRPATADHQAPKAKQFSFKVGRQTYKLPPITDAHPLLTGADLMDAVESEAAQVAYLFKSLRAVADPEVIEVLRSMNQAEMLDVLRDWGEYGDGEGTSLGE